MAAVWCFVFLSIMGVNVCNGFNPGIKARVTAGGFAKANEIALNILSSKVRGSAIPEEKGKAHHVHYEFKKMIVTEFIQPQGSITMTSSGFLWRANGASITVHGEWKYKVKTGKWKVISDHGHFDVKLLRMTFSLGISIGADPNGRPTISATGCNCDIASVHLTMHGGAAKFYNLFKKTFENDIKKTMQKKICDSGIDAVNSNARNALAKLNVTTDFGNMFTLDYRLLSKPTFQKDYMETYHKGEVFWKPSKSEVPFQAPPFPAMNATQRMLYIWLTDYTFNSFAFQAQRHRFLVYNITDKNVPVSARSYLNTTCKIGKCIGSLIPKIGQMFPNKQVEVRISSTAMPNVSVSDKIYLACQGTVGLYIPSTNGSTHLFTLNATLNAALNLTISQQKLFAKAEKVSTHLTLISSSIGQIDQGTILLMNIVFAGMVQNVINEEGKAGKSLPVIDNIVLNNSEIIFVKDSMVIATDISYKEDMEYLKFIQAPRVKTFPQGQFRIVL